VIFSIVSTSEVSCVFIFVMAEMIVWNTVYKNEGFGLGWPENCRALANKKDGKIFSQGTIDLLQNKFQNKLIPTFHGNRHQNFSHVEEERCKLTMVHYIKEAKVGNLKTYGDERKNPCSDSEGREMVRFRTNMIVNKYLTETHSDFAQAKIKMSSDDRISWVGDSSFHLSKRLTLRFSFI